MARTSATTYEMATTPNNLRHLLRVIVFESDTRAGRAFDVALLWAIGSSVAVVMLDSVGEYHARFGDLLLACEWSLTGLFTLEYLLRLWVVRRPLAYATSFFGIVDLLAIIPTYASLVVSGTQFLLVIRALRLLRAFRILKLAALLDEASVLVSALRASRSKISVFLGGVLITALIVGSIMYLVEGPEHGFTNIPRAVYWAIVTITTVGYGDIHPQTPLGQVLASVAMILGYGIIAVPTGIVTAELTHAAKPAVKPSSCAGCGHVGHDLAARFCMHCGGQL